MERQGQRGRHPVRRQGPICRAGPAPAVGGSLLEGRNEPTTRPQEAQHEPHSRTVPPCPPVPPAALGCPPRDSGSLSPPGECAPPSHPLCLLLTAHLNHLLSVFRAPIRPPPHGSPTAHAAQHSVPTQPGPAAKGGSGKSAHGNLHVDAGGARPRLPPPLPPPSSLPGLEPAWGRGLCFLAEPEVLSPMGGPGWAGVPGGPREAGVWVGI